MEPLQPPITSIPAPEGSLIKSLESTVNVDVYEEIEVTIINGMVIPPPNLVLIQKT